MPAKGWRYKVIDRLYKHTTYNEDTGCIEWTGLSNRKYGVIKIEGRREKAHRAAWEVHNGSVPSALCVLHRCDNPSCVNIAHLFLGTRGDNNTDRAEKGRSKNQHS